MDGCGAVNFFLFFSEDGLGRGNNGRGKTGKRTKPGVRGTRNMLEIPSL